MITLLLLLSTVAGFAGTPRNWSQVFEVKVRHEFYQNDDVISKPVNSWQSLFSVAFFDRDLNLSKDCVLYKVPGEEAGILKLKTVPESRSCEDFIFTPGDQEIRDVKALRFAVTETELTVTLTRLDRKVEKWNVVFQKKVSKGEPALFMSSARYKEPGIIMLAPGRSGVEAPKPEEGGKAVLCHDVSDECTEQKPSTCSQCPSGWYEVPNGCAEGPKYCGVQQCGKKGEPACRRGMRYQKVRKKFECRIDSSFAYCAPGLSVECDGNKAYCR